MADARPSKGQFSRLLKRGYTLLRRGDLDKALTCFEDALGLARSHDSDEEANKALASISACQIERGQYAKASEGLREIILSSSDDETICAAAYNLSISLRRQNRYEKAYRYARMAFEKSEALDDLNWMARCHNLMGNLYLVQSRLDKALERYEKALELRLQEKTVNKFAVTILKGNIGYCQMLQGDYDIGITNAEEALRLARKLRSKKRICESCHDLCFGYMQQRRLDEAEKLGRQALKIAEVEGYSDIIKNCYYLLGEINYLKGDEEARDHYFYLLQDMYPHLPFLRDFLCTFDVSKIIALRFPQ